MLFTEMRISVIEILNNTLDKHLPRMTSEKLILHSGTTRARRSVKTFHPYFLVFYNLSLSVMQLQGY